VGEVLRSFPKSLDLDLFLGLVLVVLLGSLVVRFVLLIVANGIDARLLQFVDDRLAVRPHHDGDAPA